MLETLHIQNYALIDDLEVDLRPGFNVLTGETGAGKSIIVDALNLVLGARASSEVVREGAAVTGSGNRAKVDAVFRLGQASRRLKQLLARAESAPEDGELILSRTVTADGRSRAYVGGNLVPIGLLAEIGDELVDLHGQHEHQSLLKPDRQLDLLDGFADADPDAVAELVARLRELDKAIAGLETDDRERARRIEFLRFELTEIDGANLTAGEEEEVKSRRNLIANAEKIFQLASHAYASLYESASASPQREDGAALDGVAAALRDLEELAAIDERFRAALGQLDGVRATVEEIAAELRGFSAGIEFDPSELEQLNQRIALIGDLKRKYGDSVAAILAYRDNAVEEVRRFEQRDQRLAEMQAERRQLVEQAQTAAHALSRKRKASASKLEKRVTSALQELGMKGGRFEVRFEDVELYSHGVDRVEFLLAANPGESPKPLRQVASGGEVSRVMLALKGVFAHADLIPTLIFDEIDAGVGGAVANKVAAKLNELAQTHQVVCVSHIPQIAAAASAHYHVAKAARKGRTVTTVARVEGDLRVEEVARLLDGSVSAVSLDHARALLKPSLKP